MFYCTFAVAGWQRTSSCENWHTEKAADTHQWYYTSTSRWLTGHLAQNWHNMISTGPFLCRKQKANVVSQKTVAYQVWNTALNSILTLQMDCTNSVAHYTIFTVFST